ncbi:TPA: hypothetical protein N0F65_000378 [Lagenidium giganteum]|uniref:Uncharacterized protein n=1 Tax=Lagenidium giganteum TaxID=4803 RepID=A0AAV2Z3P8_9STRA|nr:TPA: hypothetical protein N0F65_000378 [Lagenidium giganteum]
MPRACVGNLQACTACANPLETLQCHPQCDKRRKSRAS